MLRKLGVKGSDAELNKVVSDWDGHALTLSILAAYLAERYEGDIKHLAEIPIPTTDEPRYERVHRVLRRYDEHLTDEERDFLKLFSVFRLPVQESAFEKVFQPLLKNVVARHVVPLPEMVNRLVNYRLIRRDEHEKSYTTHPLIRNHYFALFTKGDPSQEKAAHEQIKDYYLSIAGDTPTYPILDDLKPIIEVIHHACQAGTYDEAFSVFMQNIQRGQSRNVLDYHLGAYDTELMLMLEFFDDSDTTKEPQVSESTIKSFILNEIGFCLMNLGHLREAVPFYERAVKPYFEMQEWGNASQCNINLSELYIHLGALEFSTRTASEALDLARRGESKQKERISIVRQAWVAQLNGDLAEATASFSKAEILNREIYSNQLHYLFSDLGVLHADHLRRTGQSDYARRVTEANLQICERSHWADQTSQCYRVLGDLDSDTGNHESARTHYESALKIARSIQSRYVLIEALLARGRWQAKYMKDANAAFSDLNETLGYCVESGYRIHEADVRVALGWAYLADLTPGHSPTGRGEILAKAKAEAERALQMSNEMGYHWGKVDAEEVLERIESRE